MKELRGPQVGQGRSARRKDPEELGLGRALKLYGRAFILRCPHCGRGRVVQSWFRMHPRCSACGIRTERGEEDFFLGSMMFNIILSEGLFVAFVIGLIVIRWPAVPWDFLETWAILLMVAAPFLVFPWTKTLWLASDILIRPVTEEELRWYEENQDRTIRPFEER
ncbi:MAG: DUF983 domain-containing protein [Gemmatimonadetes bacterium]|nr:DUF983 domain-containing protein [Gemmatimonadota bacterium]